MKRSSLFLLAGWMIFSVLPCSAGGVQPDQKKYQRSEHIYVIPDVTLIDQNRDKVKLVELLNSKKPVLLDFIYGTCTTICPVLSAGFSNLQKKLGPDSDQVQLVSISIDPEYDTPEVMAEYLSRYRAKPGWVYLTGTRADINQVMKAFDAYIPDKMSHYPLTLLRAPGSEKWVRLYGLIGTADLMAEYRTLEPR
jgi:protein SCO1/2